MGERWGVSVLFLFLEANAAHRPRLEGGRRPGRGLGPGGRAATPGALSAPGPRRGEALRKWGPFPAIALEGGQVYEEAELSES